ncbi:hypothetical protein LU674_020545 [Pseudomonas alloputida]|uniref:Uncharacterized protein n=3 Tax=Pseudomonas TaxID=286 RepID=A0AAW7HZZ0_9PSED|nr:MULTISPECIES: hypothetical protein [Pseudomonas]MCE0864701.1 hypothetical protein [Pseudomonas alloputida]MCE0870557.1 hypothetical protein [Pseudomonas alloputida]MCE0893672.1 hypothetical protein [Pseudomonas alloputida]MCE0924157.1 hypothetical protein [Pseudomonas alloputida]MCE1049230.1 hypothetical protein [Pseudomonas alloputida]
MDEKAAIAADTMELLLMNQTAIRAALEELSLWVSQRGSIHIHDNVMMALTALDLHAEAISVGIERLRS